MEGVCLWCGSRGRAVNSKVYLEKGIKDTVWRSLLYVATIQKYLIQQDGATSHMTKECLDFFKFGDRIISRKTEHYWLTNSPNLSHLGLSLWGLAMAKGQKSKGLRLDQLQT